MKISAIVTTYNYARFVQRAVDSVLDQTYPVAEVIVVDDGSTDNTREVLAVYGDRIKYVHQANGGISSARNTGMRHASHPWVAFLDADDRWLPEKIARQVEVAEADPALDLVYTSLWLHTPGSEPKLHTALAPHLLWPRFRYINNITPSSVMVRRETLLGAGGFDETIKRCEDWEMWVRLGPGLRCAAVEEPSVAYQIAPGSLSASVELEVATTERIAETTLLAGLTGWRRSLWRRRAMSAVLFRSSVACRADPAASRRYLLHSILRWPSPFFLPVRWRSVVWEWRRALLGLAPRRSRTAIEP